ncbi:MAG: TIM barrel protein [Phycisphaerae bacterium]|nr:TIM barrel protein [Phycisphaerae bacterium]
MLKRFNRRDFLKRTAGAGAGAWLAAAVSAEAAEQKKAGLSTPTAQKLGWEIGCQLYTFRDRSFYEALDVISELGIRHVEPCFFLPLSKDRPDLKTSEMLSADQRRELKKRLADRGVRMTNYYAPIEGDTGTFRKIFDFAKEMGVRNLVAEPPAEVFDSLEKLCDEYKINLTIHNHPKGDNSRYWRPESVLAVCEGRTKRIGSCSDTGHWVRSGLDPVACLQQMKGRIIGMHLKDVAEWGKPEARDVPLGTGKANYTTVLKELHSQKFRGLMTVEYEHLSGQLAQDVAQCVKFVEDFAKSAKR